MIAMAKAHYKGNTVVFDSPVDFVEGQELVVTYIVSPAKPRKSVDGIVYSLVGAIPGSGKSLEEYREERLSKYACAD